MSDSPTSDPSAADPAVPNPTAPTQDDPWLAALVQRPESETLDFKRQFHDNTAELLHDILCLANSYAEDHRHLVFGVADDRTPVGIEADPNRKRNADIQDMLRGSSLNRIPDVNLTEHSLAGHTVAVLTILNRPDKPFFVTEDKAHGRQLRLRNGVVYTRLGDTNVPMNESAPEDRVELMWRERFGLGLPPLERLRRLLDEAERWEKASDGVRYHVDFPEFTIADGDELVRPFKEPWTEGFPDPHCSSHYVDLRYFGTTLKRLVFVYCDGARYRIPLPERDESRFWLRRSSLAWKVSKLYDQYYPLERILPRHKVELRD
jgi:hypothetical protein